MYMAGLDGWRLNSHGLATVLSTTPLSRSAHTIPSSSRMYMAGLDGWRLNSHGLARVLSTTRLIPVRPHYSKLHKTKLHMDARTRYAFFATDKKQPAIRIDRFSEHQSNETLEKCAGHRKIQRLGERAGDIDDLGHIPTLPRPAHTDQPHRPGGAGQAGPCVARPGTFYHLKSVPKPGCDHLHPGRSGNPRRSSEEFHAGGRSKFQLCHLVPCKYLHSCRLVNVRKKAKLFLLEWQPLLFI